MSTSSAASGITPGATHRVVVEAEADALAADVAETASALGAEVTASGPTDSTSAAPTTTAAATGTEHALRRVIGSPPRR
ncbi:hypothetical protein [Actinomyces ruminicola]|uniref:hypothetical protein n=1 Tax=Actinomyces ruminicola TaxID=332524 RepID=UPI0015A4B496|nr:hypothetical protein [Actinomyces ruminicola]